MAFTFRYKKPFCERNSELLNVKCEVFKAVAITMASSGMLRRVAIVRTEFDDGGAKFLRNVGSYKSNTA
jgi:hypothetical protein